MGEILVVAGQKVLQRGGQQGDVEVSDVRMDLRLVKARKGDPDLDDVRIGELIDACPSGVDQRGGVVVGYGVSVAIGVVPIVGGEGQGSHQLLYTGIGYRLCLSLGSGEAVQKESVLTAVIDLGELIRAVGVR